MAQQLTLEKSDILGTLAVMGLFGGRQIETDKEEFSAECHSVDCSGDSKVEVRSRLLFQTIKSQENLEEFERRVWLFICTIVRYCKYTRECGNGEMRNKQLRNRKNDISQGWGVLQSSILPSKGNEKRSYYNTWYSQLVTHPGANAAEQGLILLSGRDVMLSLWYSDSQLKNGSSVNSDNFDATDLRL